MQLYTWLQQSNRFGTRNAMLLIVVQQNVHLKNVHATNLVNWSPQSRQIRFKQALFVLSNA